MCLILGVRSRHIRHRHVTETGISLPYFTRRVRDSIQVGGTLGGCPEGVWLSRHQGSEGLRYTLKQ